MHGQYFVIHCHWQIIGQSYNKTNTATVWFGIEISVKYIYLKESRSLRKRDASILSVLVQV